MLLLLPGADLGAQAPQASVQGTVRSRAGGPLPGALVVARQRESGHTGTGLSDEEGKFEIRGLAPGTYALEISHAGFLSPEPRSLTLNAGQTITLEFVLESVPETSASAPAGRINEEQLVGLPLNGRSYTQLATLEAGVTETSGESSSQGGGGGSLSVAGGRSSSNNFLLDGTNIMDTGNGVPRSAAGVQLGADAVYQVQVFSTTYGAEYGRSSGGVLNSITRSGTNEFHGTAFEYLRNSKLDARRFIDGPEPPPFKRNQFGFTLTGPVRKDRTFFMGSFEGMRNRLNQTDISFFPDELARQGIITDSTGNVIRTIPVQPMVRPYLELFPAPNSGSIGGGFARNVAPRYLPTDENYFTIRLDHAISERDSFFARYTFDDATSTRGQATYLWNTQTQSRQQYLTLVGTHIFSPSFLTAFRFGYTRPVDAIDTLSSLEIPRSLFFVPGAPQFGQIRIPGVDDFGPFFVTPEANVMNSFQFAGDVVTQKEDHGLKFGLEVHRYRWDIFNSFVKGGLWSFNSLESFLQAGPEGTTLNVALPGSDNHKGFRQTLAGFYLQDSYAPNPRLQINAGLRYEFATVIREHHGRTAFLPDPVRDTELQVGPMLDRNPSLLNFSPRLGIVWSPLGHRSFVLRTGFGIYYDELLEYVVDLQKNSAPFYNRVLRVNFDSSGTFPDAVSAAIGIPGNVEILDYRSMTSPMVLRYNLTLQHELPGGLRLEESYVGARGNHLYRGYERNLYPIPITGPDGSLFFPPNEGPINPAFESITMTGTDAQSFYNALQLSASKSLGKAGSIRGSYTYSKSVDDASTFSSGTSDEFSRQYPLMRTLDRGLSRFDIRHRLVVNYLYGLPMGKGQRWLDSGILSQLVGGWRVGGIFQFQSGTPFHPLVNIRTPGFLFSANRPNLRPGRSNNPVTGDPTRWFDESAYAVPPAGTIGNVGRNTIIGPNLFKMDFSLQKEFPLGATRQLQFRAEFFNLPNRPNYANPSGSSVYVFTGRPAGQITDTTTTARQIQLALRFSF